MVSLLGSNFWGVTSLERYWFRPSDNLRQKTNLVSTSSEIKFYKQLILLLLIFVAKSSLEQDPWWIMMIKILFVISFVDMCSKIIITEHT